MTKEGEDSSAAAERGNNFNLLRLLLALGVVAYHTGHITGVAQWAPATRGLELIADIGVQGFFVLSGYLVYSSLIRSKTLSQYAEKRIRRLYPAYAVTILACAAIALIVSPAARADLETVVRYLGWNLIFLNFGQPTLPGLFEANPFHEVNGALWTLKIEVSFYAVLPALAWLLKVTGRWRWLLIVLVYVGAEAWRQGLIAYAVLHGVAYADLASQFPGEMAFFITGLAFAMIERPPWAWLAPLGLVVLTASLVAPELWPALTPEAGAMRAFGLGVTAIWLAKGWPQLFDPARIGDLSYGVYIVHFPVLQALVAAGLFAASPWLGAGAGLAASLLLALAMWWGVERPALRRDSAYRQAGR